MKIKDNSNFKAPAIGIYNDSFIRGNIYKFQADFESINPDKLHRCPLKRNLLKEFNISSSNKLEFETVLPNGDYKYQHKIWNDGEDNIFTKTVYETYKTDEDSFF